MFAPIGLLESEIAPLASGISHTLMVNSPPPPPPALGAVASRRDIGAQARLCMQGVPQTSPRLKALLR